MPKSAVQQLRIRTENEDQTNPDSELSLQHAVMQVTLSPADLTIAIEEADLGASV